MYTGTISKSDQAPEKRANASFHYYNGKHILIGGGGRSKEYNDVWSLGYNKDNHALKWEKIEQKGAISYTPRTGQASVLCKDKVFVYGGQNFHEAKQYSDAFLYDIEKNTWETLSKQNKPIERNSCSVGYDEKRNRIILFGGANTSGPLSDIYSFDFGTNAWEKLDIKGQLKPVGREMQGTVTYNGKLEFPNIQYEAPEKKEKQIDLNFISGIEAKGEETKTEEPENEKEEEEAKISDNNQNNQTEGEVKEGTYLLVFGGRHGEEFSQEILALDLETLEWKYLGNMPFTICAHSCELAGDKVFVFGGTDGMQFLDNLYYFDLKNRQWYVYKRGKNEEILPRIAASMSYNPETKEVLIFGGCSYEDELNETKILKVDDDSLKKSFQPLKVQK